MSTRKIPAEEWPTFFDEFSKKHQGKRASAQLHGQGVIQHEEVDYLPFSGVTLEEKGSDSNAVRVMLGDSAEDHLTHEVPAPHTVWVRPHADTGTEMLEIQGEEHTLILTFE